MMIRGIKIVFPFVMISLLAAAPNVFPAQKHECGSCHLTGSAKMELKSPLSELCGGCHPGRRGRDEHKVDIVPSMKIADLPLGKDGKLTCITCHDPHEKEGYPMMLRAKPPELCVKCHLK